RSSFRIAKNLTKSKYGKMVDDWIGTLNTWIIFAGFSRGTNLFNSDRNVNRIGSLFVTRQDSQTNISTPQSNKTPPRLPRSSTLPQTFQTPLEESHLSAASTPVNSTPAAPNEMGFKSPLSSY